jgi:hypothetical protein
MFEELTNFKINLDAEPTEDIYAGIWKGIREKYLPHLIGYIIVFFLILIFVPYFLGEFFVFSFVFFGISVYSIIQKKKREFTQAFGKSIGFTYTETASIESVYGSLFDSMRGQRIYDVLTGNYQNIPIRIFSYSFSIGSNNTGRTSQPYAYTVFEATFAGSLPNILLFSKKHISVANDWFSENTTILLEGNSFNEYFKLRVPKGHEQEAYQIFTPDVMANLINGAHEYSFEFIGNKLYIYATRIITNKSDFKYMFDWAQYFIAVFNKSTSKINVTPKPPKEE